MFPIVNIDYEKVLEETKKQGYKCVILLLYSADCKFYECSLSERFEEINGNTGRKVIFITHYANLDMNYKPPEYLVNYRNWGNMDKSPGRTVGSKQEEDALAYKTMREVAKSFDCGMENRLPCFVIFNPNNPQFFVEKSAKDVDDIFVETQLMVMNLQRVNYNIEEYAKYNKETYYYLSSSELLERNIKAGSKGIEVKHLLDVIESNNAKDCFDLNEINRLQKQGYIPIKTFYRNLDRIRVGDIPEGTLSELIDKYLLFNSTSREMLFSEIAEYVESSSRDYLRSAKSFFTGDIDAENIKASMIAVCLGKVVEDELNLGIFNAFRGAFNVSLPQYYDKYQEGISSLGVNFWYDDINGNKTKVFIRFNERENDNTCKLLYPKVSQIRRIAFDKSCNAGNESKREYVSNARMSIEMVRNDVSGIAWTDIFTRLETISNVRNHAIHHAKPIKGREARKAYEAFEYLVKIHFFEVNSILKQLKN